MSSSETLIATKREKLGTLAANKLRKEGLIPGNVYGLSQDPVSISTASEKITNYVFSGHKIVECEIDGNVETTIIKEVQWDTFGIRIEHFDLLRIDPTKKISVDVDIKLRGNAVGVTSGGVLVQNLRLVTIECLAINVPDNIKVRINSLEIGDSLLVSDLEAPSGVTITTPGTETIVHVNEPAEDEEEIETDESGPAQPEVIGRKKDDEEGGE